MAAVKKPPVPQAGSITVLALVQAWVDPVDHELGNGAGGVELPGIAGTAQVVEHLLVHIPKAGAGLEVVKVDGFFQLLDDGQHLRAGFHVVVGVLERPPGSPCAGDSR